MQSLKGRSFLKLKDFSSEEIGYMLELSKKLKQKKKSGEKGSLLAGKNIVLLFEKTSTRTRCAFEVAAYDEGANVTFLSNSQFGKKESIEDSAKVLGRFYDGIQFRGFEQETVKMLADYSGVPVWNGLTDLAHPTQTLADFLTIMEHVDKPLSQVKLVYVGDARNNVCNSLMVGSAKMGMNFVALAPKELWPSPQLLEDMKPVCEETGASISVTESMDDIQGADAVYTDVWVSMGEEDMFEERIKQLLPYQVDMNMMKKIGTENAIFLHCLPAYHDLHTEVGLDVFEKFGLKEMEVTDEVFRAPMSKVFDQAENRLHTIKAVMVATLSEGK
ncbi:ornithine carbamoyltransferase ArgF [Peptoclostridium acidaminophilum DSM 3953]|uniref:Ornithine carbamoyltransferase n=1 Tax=Peptoclostridium acidaminophilum DSM 3953 TaxID=1286171 RepID=W8TFA6_PEPAC|nr:ornithine carbamoyltransferase [Peptoclostridium acidaminophilum]AHM56508.1 ornithine carbamoyltransferase ArgF [Peptoclostridium acidaminophilum DSM 3953]